MRNKTLDIAYKLLNDCDTVKKMKALGLPTLALLNDAWSSLRDVELRKQSTTICLEVAQFFKKHGFKVTEKGIGWEIRA